MAALFNLTASGSGSVGLSTWVDLGPIPTGYDFWIGSTTFTAPDKSLTFELRTNNTGKAAGTTADTTVLSTASPKVGTSVTTDLYRKGRLHTKTATGTGVEHWWLRIASKSSTAGSYLYKISYTQE